MVTIDYSHCLLGLDVFYRRISSQRTCSYAVWHCRRVIYEPRCITSLGTVDAQLVLSGYNSVRFFALRSFVVAVCLVGLVWDACGDCLSRGMEVEKVVAFAVIVNDSTKRSIQTPMST